MTRLSFSVKHILAVQERCCWRHVRVAHEELHTYKQSSDKLLRLEILLRSRKGRRRAWSSTDHSFPRWSFLFHRRHRHTSLRRLSCCSVISPEVDPLTCDGRCIKCRRKDQGFRRKDGGQRLDRERQDLMNSSIETTPRRTPFCTIFTSTPHADLKTANGLSQHQREKLNNSPETQKEPLDQHFCLMTDSHSLDWKQQSAGSLASRLLRFDLSVFSREEHQAVTM